MRKRTLAGLALMGAGVVGATSTANYPFPQNATYAYGIKSEADASTMASNIQTAYTNWLSNQYVESGSYARVKYDDATYTVSEGIGYGMLIFVYMDNTTNDTKSKFDKLWAYYKHWEDSYGLMNWKIQGFDAVNGSGGATDADVDVAVALLMAYKQWGDEQYLTDAKTLINAIGKYELSSSHAGILKPGDSWESFYNPSYTSGVALHLFQQVNSTYNWSTALTANLTMLTGNANSTSGLPSDWCSYSGTPVAGNSSINFGYDAVRTPWRMSWDYAWYGDATAKTLNDKISTWIMGKTSSTPTSIVAGYSLDGTATASYSNATYTGALVAAGMTNSSNQTWMTKGWTALANADASTYYNRSLKVLYQLLISGNMKNFWATSSSTKYTLTTTADHGTITKTPSATSYDSGSTVTVKVTPDAGYTFSGWSGASTSKDTSITLTMTENKTLTANFTAKVYPNYTLKLKTQVSGTDCSTCGTVTLNPALADTGYDSGTAVQATASPATGYKFQGWGGARSGTSITCTVTMTRDTTLIARFIKTDTSSSDTTHTVPSYTLTTTAVNGTITLSPASDTGYDSGTSVKATAKANSGYVFSSWSGACTGSSSTCTVSMTANKTLTAVFTKTNDTTLPKTFTVATSASNGTITLSPAGGSYDSGATVTATATALSGYEFSGWSGACTGSEAVCTLTVDTNKVLVAAFTATADNTDKYGFVIGGDTTKSTITFSPAGGMYAVGTKVLVTVTPKEGYVFSGWYGPGDCTDSYMTDTCTVTIPTYSLWIGWGLNASTSGIINRSISGQRLSMLDGSLVVDPSGMGTARVDLITLDGRVENIWRGSSEGTVQLNLGSRANGLYLIRMSSSKASYQKMIQIMR